MPTASAGKGPASARGEGGSRSGRGGERGRGGGGEEGASDAMNVDSRGTQFTCFTSSKVLYLYKSSNTDQK